MILFCHITSHVDSDPHPNLLSEKGGNAFPTIKMLDADGNVLATLGRVPRTTDSFKALQEEAKHTAASLEELATKAKDGDKEAALALFEKRLELSHLDLASAKAGYAALGELPAEKAEELQQKLLGLEIAEIMSTVTRNDPETQIAAGAKFAELVKAGRIPTDRNAKLNCWYFVSLYAEKQMDAELYQKAFEAFKAQPGIRPQFLEQMEKKLEAMRKGKGGD